MISSLIVIWSRFRRDAACAQPNSTPAYAMRTNLSIERRLFKDPAQRTKQSVQRTSGG